MIEVVGVCRNFGEIVALDEVSFKVAKGQIVGFLGANGAGKTTTMDIISGCLGAHRGQVTLAGFDVFEQPKQAKARLGYLPDEPPLHMDMKVAEFLDYAARLRGLTSSEVQARLSYVLDKLSLGDKRSQLIAHLSKGYRQRVGLAQALIHDPEVLILDEPTEGLDPNQIVQIRELIKSLKGEHTILFSSHILSEVESLCDEIVIIHEGKVVEQGSYLDIIQRSQTSHVYRLKVERGADQLVQTLSGLNGLSNVVYDQQDGLFQIHTDGSENAKQTLLESVLKGQHGLEHFSQYSQSLEDVFTKLTH